jgi:hypothetical protein
MFRIALAARNCKPVNGKVARNARLLALSFFKEFCDNCADAAVLAAEVAKVKGYRELIMPITNAVLFAFFNDIPAPDRIALCNLLADNVLPVLQKTQPSKPRGFLDQWMFEHTCMCARYSLHVMTCLSSCMEKNDVSHEAAVKARRVLAEIVAGRRVSREPEILKAVQTWHSDQKDTWSWWLKLDDANPFTVFGFADSSFLSAYDLESPLP